jgi:hypothetical protein
MISCGERTCQVLSWISCVLLLALAGFICALSTRTPFLLAALLPLAAAAATAVGVWRRTGLWLVIVSVSLCLFEVWPDTFSQGLCLILVPAAIVLFLLAMVCSSSMEGHITWSQCIRCWLMLILPSVASVALLVAGPLSLACRLKRSICQEDCSLYVFAKPFG